MTSTLLINMPVPLKRSFGRQGQPLGVAYLGAWLRTKGYPVDIWDANLAHASSTDVVEYVLAHPHDIVGFSATSAAFPYVIEAAMHIKSVDPTIYLICGGHHVTANSEEALTTCRALDAVCCGEGELTLSEIVEGWSRGRRLDGVLGCIWRDGERIIQNPARPLIADLDLLPFPARDLLPSLIHYSTVYDLTLGQHKVIGTLTASRGCPYACKFCDIRQFYSHQSGPRRRWRRPERVVDEIEELVTKFGAQHVAFCDDLFLLDPDWIVPFTHLMCELGSPVTFSIATRPDDVVRHSEMLPLLKKTGCISIELGVESGSQTVLERYNKDTTVDLNYQAVRLVRQYQIIPLVDFIMFDPLTTLEELRDSMRFLGEAISPAYYPPVVYSSLDLYPGTALSRNWGLVTSQNRDEGPGYAFQSAEVGKVYAGIIRFRNAFQQQINELVRSWQSCHQNAQLVKNVQLRKLAVREIYRLCEFPYQVLRDLVDAATGGADITLTAEQACKDGELLIARSRFLLEACADSQSSETVTKLSICGE